MENEDKRIWVVEFETSTQISYHEVTKDTEYFAQNERSTRPIYPKNVTEYIAISEYNALKQKLGMDT